MFHEFLTNIKLLLVTIKLNQTLQAGNDTDKHKLSIKSHAVFSSNSNVHHCTCVGSTSP